MKESLDFIYKEQKELSIFGGVAALLGWDQMTYMPSKGSEERAEQLSLIARLSHERAISDEFYRHITKLFESSGQLEEKDRIIVIRLKDDIEKTRKIPPQFVEEISRVTTLAYAVWQKAREKNAYKLFAPHLEKIIELERQYCDYIKLPGHPYNSLLDDYEEGMTVDILKKEFSLLRPQLVDILNRIKGSSKYTQQRPLKMNLTSDQQKELCTVFLSHLNFPFDRARMDVSTHPFTTAMADDDVRITTNYEREGLLSSFFSTVHEAGHALYELDLPKGQFKDTVISDAPSLGIHESQSRFWENMIARSRAFWTFFSPEFQRVAPKACKGIDADGWYTAVNQVRPSFIRVEADELTYCLHVILRFELELELLEEKTTVKELPQQWNEKMTDFLGITPKTDKDGVLQDMHWSGGSFGYFPTYAIGTIYASQLFQRLKKDQKSISEDLAQGKYSSIAQWLDTHIHRYGRLMTADALIKKTCGEGLNSKVFVAYLKDKYYPLYDV